MDVSTSYPACAVVQFWGFGAEMGDFLENLNPKDSSAYMPHVSQSPRVINLESLKAKHKSCLPLAGPYVEISTWYPTLIETQERPSTTSDAKNIS